MELVYREITLVQIYYPGQISLWLQIVSGSYGRVRFCGRPDLQTQTQPVNFSNDHHEQSKITKKQLLLMIRSLLFSSNADTSNKHESDYHFSSNN